MSFNRKLFYSSGKQQEQSSVAIPQQPSCRESVLYSPETHLPDPAYYYTYPATDIDITRHTAAYNHAPESAQPRMDVGYTDDAGNALFIHTFHFLARFWANVGRHKLGCIIHFFFRPCNTCTLNSVERITYKGYNHYDKSHSSKQSNMATR